MDQIMIGEGLAAGAGALAALALILRDPLRLRLLILLAAACGVASAVMLEGRVDPRRALELATLGLGLAALGAVLGLARAAWSASAVSVRARNRPLRRAFGPIPPAAFRALMRLAERRTLTQPQRLTREGWAPEQLWYLVEGVLRVEQDGRATEVEGPFFVGEVSFVTGATAPATITALPGADLLEWDGKALRRAFRADPSLRPAVEAILGRDLARKVSAARPAAELGGPEREAPARLAV
ncbi:cyclic nucleotide-binding domain-containing protein [Albimonas sp. CAU 1670]|uniref:Crp/Fnr family transcriptional regulator n=1 Tax=Albimonas sp. CAU 1670 TaxID=3032599 RepID=UPI0023D9E3E0|nr:cyclic nucleotide-binding domain-containing protein [Albimonas sp. CAU 1670]MDF2233454.1 cyclic nucleotide-binding domain-containing protein [Albimonas sp. CAU 1670]